MGYGEEFLAVESEPYPGPDDSKVIWPEVIEDVPNRPDAVKLTVSPSDAQFIAETYLYRVIPAGTFGPYPGVAVYLEDSMEWVEDLSHNVWAVVHVREWKFP